MQQIKLAAGRVSCCERRPRHRETTATVHGPEADSCFVQLGASLRERNAATSAETWCLNISGATVRACQTLSKAFVSYSKSRSILLQCRVSCIFCTLQEILQKLVFTVQTQEESSSVQISDSCLFTRPTKLTVYPYSCASHVWQCSHSFNHLV